MQYSIGPSPSSSPPHQHSITTTTTTTNNNNNNNNARQGSSDQHQQRSHPTQSNTPTATTTTTSHSKSTYFPVLRRIQSRKREKENHSSTNLLNSLLSPSSSTHPPLPPSSTEAHRNNPNQSTNAVPASSSSIQPPSAPRRSTSQPPPIPRVIRSATERFRIHHHHQQSSASNSSHTNPQPPCQTLRSQPNQSLNSVPAITSSPPIRSDRQTNPSNPSATTATTTLSAPTTTTTTTQQDSHMNNHSSPLNYSTNNPYNVIINHPSSNSNPTDQPSNSVNPSSSTMYSLRLVPHLDATRSLHFEPIERKMGPSNSLKLGRFTDRGTPQSNSDTRIAFKSKVVSRGHADIFTDQNGSFFIKDTKSSSGTFLNHIRLSAPGGESRPFPLRDGDVLQLGVDYQGGTEEIYRCVKMRVELNRGWQRSANVFNQQALSQLRMLGIKGSTPNPTTSNQTAQESITDSSSAAALKPVSDCCICLFGVTVCQALFIAPCSHTYHYKCIRPLLQMHHPGFSCPLCRTFADLEADVETEDLAQPTEAVPTLAPPNPSLNQATLSHPPSNLPIEQRNGVELHSPLIDPTHIDPSAIIDEPLVSTQTHHPVVEDENSDVHGTGDNTVILTSIPKTNLDRSNTLTATMSNSSRITLTARQGHVANNLRPSTLSMRLVEEADETCRLQVGDPQQRQGGSSSLSSSIDRNAGERNQHHARRPSTQSVDSIVNSSMTTDDNNVNPIDLNHTGRANPPPHPSSKSRKPSTVLVTAGSNDDDQDLRAGADDHQNPDRLVLIDAARKSGLTSNLNHDMSLDLDNLSPPHLTLSSSPPPVPVVTTSLAGGNSATPSN